MSSVSSLSSGSVGQNVVLTQPAAKTVQLGQTVSIDCKASPKVAHYTGSQYHLAWYHQKTGEAPKLLIYRTSDRFSGISSRFSGSGAGNGVVLKHWMPIAVIRFVDILFIFTQRFAKIASFNPEMNKFSHR